MKHQGFTLLETILYCALFGILMSGTIVAVYALMSSNENTKMATAVVAEGNFINQKLSWLFTGAVNVTQINSSSLQIERPDLGVDSPIIISSQNNNLYIKRRGSDPRPLTGAPFVITDAVMQYDTKTVSIMYKINDTSFRFSTQVPY